MKRPAIRISVFIVPATCALLLFAPTALFAAGGGGEPMSMTDILWDMGLKFLNVTVLGFLAFKYLSKPLNKLVESRSEKVLKELEDAKAGRRAAEEQLRSFQEKTAGLDKEIEALRKQTCSDIDKEQKNLFHEAREAAEHIRQHARDSIHQEVLKARDELHTEAARLATKLSRELIEKNINAEDHDRLVSAYLKEMEAAK